MAGAKLICISVEMLAKAGREAELRRALETLAAQSRKEPGCLSYLVHRGLETPQRFYLYEQYQDMAAVEAHRATDHYRLYAEELIPTLVDDRKLDLWETNSGQ